MRGINFALGLLLVNSLTTTNIAQASTVPANTAVNPNQIGMLLQQQALAQALVMVNAGLATDPNNTALLQQRIVIYKLMQQPDNARADFDKLISLSTSEADKNSLMAYKASYFNQFNDAKTYIDTAIRLDPNNPDYYSRRAEILMDLNQSDAALADINKALELDPKFYGAYYARSRIYEKLGDKLKSEQDFAMAEKLKAEATGQPTPAATPVTPAATTIPTGAVHAQPGS